jgi:flagella basal body P-ring formation protein FlgA
MRRIVFLAILFHLALAAASNPATQPQSKPQAGAVNDGYVDQNSGFTITPLREFQTGVSRSEIIWQVTSRRDWSPEGSSGTVPRSGMPRIMSESEVESAIRASLGRDDSELRLEITALSQETLPSGYPTFPLSGASKPSSVHPDNAVLWRGQWRTTDGRILPIWARVRALCPRNVVRLRADVPAGTLLTTAVLEQANNLDSVFRIDPPETLDQYEGKILKHSAKAGSILSLKQVVEPPLVLRNTMVRVEAAFGNLHLHVEARAAADGRAGDSIRLVVPGGHRQFFATIQPDGSAVVNVARDNLRDEKAQRGERNGL